jgi:hypothetical protein
LRANSLLTSSPAPFPPSTTRSSEHSGVAWHLHILSCTPASSRFPQSVLLPSRGPVVEPYLSLFASSPPFYFPLLRQAIEVTVEQLAEALGVYSGVPDRTKLWHIVCLSLEAPEGERAVCRWATRDDCPAQETSYLPLRRLRMALQVEGKPDAGLDARSGHGGGSAKSRVHLQARLTPVPQPARRR